jgi:hypothetical protein
MLRSTVVASFLLAPVAAAPQEPRDAGLRPFLERHCFECHGEDAKKKALRLDGPSLDHETWIKVFDRVESGEMPPPRQARPPKNEVAAFLARLNEPLARASLARREGQGRAVFRRLNRAEYENTLRDLLGLPTLSVQVLLPEDGRVAGFNKVGGALDLSHVQLARYMEVADLALDMATATPPEPPAPAKVRFSASANFGEAFWRGDTIFITKDRTWNREYPGPQTSPSDYDAKMTRVADNPETVGVFRPEFYKFPYKFWTGYRRIVAAPVAGWYRFRISLWSFRFDRGAIKPASAPQVALLRAGPRPAAYVDAPSWEPKVHDVELWLEKNELPGFSAHSLVFEPPHGGLPGLEKQSKHGIAIDWAEMEGPIARPRRPLVEDADPRRALEIFARRAFRRPAPPAEIERHLAIVKARLEAKASAEDALRAGFKAILCSPDFLFLRERPGALDDWALASRLSYFLWNSMPDDALLALAEKGELRKPEVLKGEVERLLRDPKGERFVEDFTDQWLELRDIDDTCPDTNLYPEFNAYLKDCMVGESRAFFRELLRDDRPAVEIVHSDWAMLNQGIAEFYGVPDVRGPAYRKVTLPPGSHRGGVLTQAAVLKVTANGTTTTPVRRGAWVLQNILNRPPDPPPPDIPAVEPDIKGATTIREQLAKHRSQPACATCHVKIDPLGMALESFDVMGGWRTRYRSLGAGDRSAALSLKGRPITFFLAKPVDPSGELLGQGAFKDVDEFKRLLARDPGRITRAMAEKLLVYATGAPLEFADRAAVDEIVRRSRGLRSLLHAVVASPVFQSK